LLADHAGVGPKGRLLIPPGGGVEYGEDLQSCLKREFREETGLNIQVENLLFINEFIDSPLHAIEFFFKVKLISGQLQTGEDPELRASEQLLRKVSYYTHQDLLNTDTAKLHNVLQHEPDPIKFEHLTGFFNFVVNS